MEFHEKLQKLRKSRGLTQEELAEALYVSRTAISKWESGKGYPNIDSLKGISSYFSVTIDELLSGEKLLSIAEKENKSNLQNMCDFLIGILDVCSSLLILLPLYPNTVDGLVYSVNLFSYVETTPLLRLIHWILFVSMTFLGIMKILLLKCKPENRYQFMTDISLGFHIIIVLFLAMTREAYAIVLAFLLLVIKASLLTRPKSMM